MPDTSAWRPRRVVSPNDRFERAYSSLPTRIRVSSSRRTTAARTFARDRPVRRDRAASRARMRGSACAEGQQAVELVLVRGPGTAGGSDTACGHGRPARSPGDGRADRCRSRRRSRPAGWPASGSVRSPRDRGSALHPGIDRRTRAVPPAGDPGAVLVGVAEAGTRVGRGDWHGTASPVAQRPLPLRSLARTTLAIRCRHHCSRPDR